MTEHDTISPLPWFLRVAALIALAIERIWPAFLRAFVGLASVLGFTLLGGWQLLTPLAHAGLLALAGGAFVWVLIEDLKDVAWPRRIDVLRRLEADNNLRHQPLQSLEDHPFAGSAALWHAHREKSRRATSPLRLKLPVATIDRHDPFSVRYMALFAVLFSGILAGPDIKARLLAIKPPPLIATGSLSGVIWLDAPSYTGRAPLTLWSTDADARAQHSTADRPLGVPRNSTVEMRLSAKGAPWWRRPSVVIQSASSRERYHFRDSTAETDRSGRSSYPITEDMRITARLGTKKHSWHLSALPDTPPRIRLERAIATNENEKLEIRVEVDDDYGIVKGIARLQLVADQPLPLDSPAPVAEVTQRAVDIPLPYIQGKSGLRSQELDLRQHPWAGLQVDLSIGGCDGAGQCQFTPAQTLTLPHRVFYNPLAKTIIEERRTLAIAPKSRERTRRTLLALTTTPSLFFDDLRPYLLLRSAFWQVSADGPRPSEQIVEDFWTLALHLEDDALAIARKALDDAQAALRDAVRGGADAVTIKQLTEDLRRKIEAYKQALAQSGAEPPDRQNQQQVIGEGELDRILDQINDLAGAGADRAAEQLLAKLEQLLQNIELSEGATAAGQAQGADGANGADGGSPQQRAIGAAGRLITQQREIGDATFDAARAQHGLDTVRDAQSGISLGDMQGSLADQTARIAAQLTQAADGGQNPSPPPPGSAPETVAAQGAAFTDAARASLEAAARRMQSAAQLLRAGNFVAAIEAQDEAIEDLREGAIALSRAGGADAPDGETSGGEDTAAARGQEDGAGGPLNDPLGRAYSPDPNADAILPEISDPTRARRLTEKIRERLTSGNLSPEEQDYLQRLLERFSTAPPGATPSR